MRANSLPFEPHYYVPHSARKYNFFGRCLVQLRGRKWIETAKLWPFGLLPRGGTDRASGEGGGRRAEEGIYPRNFGLFMTSTHKSTKVGAAPLFCRERGREEREGFGRTGATTSKAGRAGVECSGETVLYCLISAFYDVEITGDDPDARYLQHSGASSISFRQSTV